MQDSRPASPPAPLFAKSGLVVLANSDRWLGDVAAEESDSPAMGVRRLLFDRCGSRICQTVDPLCPGVL
jgi:hypothetical protein